MTLNLSRDLQRLIFLTLVFAAGVYILLPQINYQPIILQGDNGKDLYVFQQTAQGAKPYHDYWWVYGPLMPYYYGTCLKIFGFQISSVLIGEFFLIFLHTIVVYLTLLLLISPAMSFLGAIWFLAFHENFYHTYNHAGTMLFVYLGFYFLLSFLKEYKERSLYYCLGFIALAALTKLNMGLAAYAAVILTLFITSLFDKKIALSQRFYVHAFLTGPLVVMLGYAYFVAGIPFLDLNQYFPGTPTSYTVHRAIYSSFILWGKIIGKNIISAPIDFIFAIIINGSFINLFYLIRKDTVQPLNRRFVMYFFLAAGIFYMFLMHEFWLTLEIYKTFWARLLSMYLIFVCLYGGTIHLNSWIKKLLYALLIVIASLQIIQSRQLIQQIKIPERYLSLEHGHVYITNPPDWINTVTETTRQVNALLKKGETFFVLPYDPLYYFLTDRKSPTKELIFFEFLNFSDQALDEVIKSLEEKNVQYVVLSNRLSKIKPENGNFQQTYCPKINAYLNDHFKIVSVIGNWDKRASHFENHATMILKRQ